MNDLFRFLPDGQFIWGSERDGFRHLYLYDLNGKQHKRLTEGQWEVESVAGVNEPSKTLYFVSSETSPLERQLYSIKLNGKDRTRISQGAGTHSISMSPTTEYYMDTFSSLTQPSRKTLHNVRRRRMGRLPRSKSQIDGRVRAASDGNRQFQRVRWNAVLRPAHQAG